MTRCSTPVPVTLVPFLSSYDRSPLDVDVPAVWAASAARLCRAPELVCHQPPPVARPLESATGAGHVRVHGRAGTTMPSQLSDVVVVSAAAVAVTACVPGADDEACACTRPNESVTVVA